MRDLPGKRVLVTGAGRGIGRALALRFARERAHVVVTDVDAAPLAAVLEEIRAESGETSSALLDVTSRESVDAARARIHGQGGSVDVNVNNAGTVTGGAFLDVPLERHLATYEINLLGLVRVTHAFLPDLLSRGRGHIVNIASASGYLGLPYGSTYASSKWGVIGLSESLRREVQVLGSAGIRVTTVCPGYIDTGLFEGARAPRTTRMLTPEVLAERVLRAVRKDRPFVRTPWIVKVGPLLRGVLPTPLFDRVTDAFGIGVSMQDWRGHAPD